ncbi:hypothetical protein KR084_011141, partial [Drosophila pseudotakahashii]
VKVRETKYLMFHGDIQGGRAGYSWGPFQGRVMVGISGFINGGTFNEGDKVCASYVDLGAIVHLHASRAIVYNYDAFIYAGNGK